MTVELWLQKTAQDSQPKHDFVGLNIAYPQPLYMMQMSIYICMLRHETKYFAPNFNYFLPFSLFQLSVSMFLICKEFRNYAECFHPDCEVRFMTFFSEEPVNIKAALRPM